MPRAVLLGRPDIEDGDLAVPHAAQQLFALDGLHRSALLEVLARDLLDLGEARLGEPAQREEEGADFVASQAVLDVETLLLGLYESRSAEHLQVLGSIRDGDAGLLGERFDRPRALAEEVEQFEPLGSRDGFPKPSKLLVDAVLEPPRERPHALKYSTRRLNSQDGLPFSSWNRDSSATHSAPRLLRQGVTLIDAAR